jgi:hypothetical protein
LAVIKSLLFRDKVFGMVVFVILLNITPSFDSLTTFYMTDTLKFSSMDLADFSTLGTIFYLLGLILYSNYFQKVAPQKIFVVTNFLWLLFNVSFLMVVFGLVEKYGMSNKYFCYFTSGIQNFIGEMNFMPLLAIWCAICPKNLEATSITLFTGLINFASSISCYLGSFVSIALNVSKNNLNEIWKPLLV